ncbi:MAG TPA: TetR/AcrR family transcriptional regulator [Cellulomonas sp.]
MTSTRAEGARARARRETVQAITDAARTQLGEVGAPALSVRAVTRELGMAASSVYRYFPNRDALLTALILDAYRGVAAAAVGAESLLDRADLLGRWIAVHRGVRGWALEHPHEYALIYGSPVPGYAAPEDTVGPAAEVALLLAAIAVEAWTAPDRGAEGRSADRSAEALSSETRPDQTSLGSDLLADLRGLLDQVLSAVPEGRRSDLATLRPDRVLAVLDAWTELFGSISFELFGHYRHVIDARGEHLDAVALRTAEAAGVVVRG